MKLMSIWYEWRHIARRWWHRIYGAVGGHDVQIQLLRKRGMGIGKNCRIYTEHFGSEPWLIRIGDHCTVTSGVRFVTHDGSCWVFREEHPGLQDFAPIIVEDNCFIGVNAIILPGTRIGPNSVVAAGAVVARDVPPNTVAGGVPARPIQALEDFKKKKIEKFGAFDVPSDPVELRRHLEERFKDLLNRS
jgi:acetyltransferase-like isoleucine patch superfamily enzyme